MIEVALLSHVSWMDYCRAKIRVGKKKREVCHGYDKYGLPFQLSCDHILSRTRHRYSDRGRHCTSSCVLLVRPKG